MCLAALVARGLPRTSAPFVGGGMGDEITDLGRDLLAVLDEYAAEDGQR